MRPDATRGIALGTAPGERRRALLAAAALLAVTAAVAFVSELASLPAGKLSPYGFVLLGALLAPVAAYRGSGLLVCWLLTLAPVVGPLVVYRGFMYVRGPVPVGLPLSFHGTGAGTLFVPLAVVLGPLGFCAGAASRRALRLVRSGEATTGPRGSPDVRGSDATGPARDARRRPRLLLDAPGRCDGRPPGDVETSPVVRPLPLGGHLRPAGRLGE